jgi:hypothetical protein
MESTINPKILQQIAKDNNIVIGGELYADSLGDKDSPANTYLKMLRYNAETIFEGLTTAKAIESEKTKDSGGSNFLTYILLGLGFVAIMFFVVRRLNNN